MTDTNSKAQVTDDMVEAGARAMCEAWHYARIGTPDGNAEWKGKQAQYRKQSRAAISAALAAQEKPDPGVAVPAGWKLVPVEPTADMVTDGRIVGGDFGSCGYVSDYGDLFRRQWARALAVAPSPDLPEGEVARKFNLGDHVHKVKGASWTGHVVGFYSTELTPVGYAVESSREKGSVQIYPEAALEFSTSPSPIDKGEVK